MVTRVWRVETYSHTQHAPVSAGWCKEKVLQQHQSDIPEEDAAVSVGTKLNLESMKHAARSSEMAGSPPRNRSAQGETLAFHPQADLSYCKLDQHQVNNSQPGMVPCCTYPSTAESQAELQAVACTARTVFERF